jgi:hypothetical protein
LNVKKEVPVPSKVDHKTKSERIELIDTLLEDAAEIVVDLKRGNNKQNDKQEMELLSLLFQILSLLYSIRAEYNLENFTDIDSELPIKKVYAEMGADIIQLDRRKFEGERRIQYTYIANDKRNGFPDRRQKKAF